MIFFRSPGDRQRARAQRAIRRSEQALANNDAETALSFNRRAEEAVRAALSLEPGSDDKKVLAALLYNRSTILLAAGDLDGAFDAANSALDFYHALDPTHFNPDAVRSVLAATQLPTVVTDYREVHRAAAAHKQLEQQLEEAIAHAADARIRCVRLASLRGDNARRWIERHGEPAVQTYRELVRYGHHFTEADLRRVTGTLETARQGLTD